MGMLEHGKYSIELIGQVLHVYPKGSFNEFGILALHAEIHKRAPKGQPWVLIEHPKNVAGLTPNAILALCCSYANLPKANCKAVGLNVMRLWEVAIKKAMSGKMEIPVYFENGSDYLLDKVSSHLAD